METMSKTMNSSGLEHDDMEFQNFLLDYKGKSGSQKFTWWMGEFNRLISSTPPKVSLYQMFNKESYDHWVTIDEDFDDILFQLCMEYDIEYEFAFMLCELERGSEQWKHCLDINED